MNQKLHAEEKELFLHLACETKKNDKTVEK